jgi:hypothetical protein
MSNQIYSHAEVQKIISLAYESYNLIKSLEDKNNLTQKETRLQDSSIKYIRSLMSKHWFYGYLTETQFKELSLV